jgi:hypothetical protein
MSGARIKNNKVNLQGLIVQRLLLNLTDLASQSWSTLSTPPILKKGNKNIGSVGVDWLLF